MATTSKLTKKLFEENLPVINNMSLTFQERSIKFNSLNVRESFHHKTSFENLPLEMKLGSSTHHPERKGGMTTCDLVLWVKFIDDNWFRPYGRFNTTQIKGMIELCENDLQIISLMELLRAKKA